MAKVAVQVSGHGKKAGFLVGAYQGETLSLLVLPKVWRRHGESAGVFTASWQKGKPLALVLHEMDTLVLDCLPTQKYLLEQMLAASSTCGTKTDDEQDDKLLRLVAVRDAKEITKAPIEEPFWALMQLAIMTSNAGSRVGAGPGAGGIEGDAVGQFSVGLPEHHWLGQLLQRQRFVQAVARQLRDIRQGYVEFREVLPMVRGRITANGAARASLLRTPSLECLFDEFTDATPLFRVLVSALEVASTRMAIPGAGSLAEALPGRVAEEAMRLRGQLQRIPAMMPSQASVLASRIHLPRSQWAWQQSLDLAIAILAEQEPCLAPACIEPAQTLIWWLETNRLWEQVLETALAMHGWQRCQAPTNAEPWRLWRSLGNEKRPDLVYGNEGWILDAKYKSLPNDKAPSMSDQYQMFAYSQLGQAAFPDLKGVALVYPAHNTSVAIGQTAPLASRSSGPFDRGSCSVDRADQGALHIVAAAFPGQKEASAAKELDSWLRRLGADLIKVFG